MGVLREELGIDFFFFFLRKGCKRLLCPKWPSVWLDIAVAIGCFSAVPLWALGACL